MNKDLMLIMKMAINDYKNNGINFNLIPVKYETEHNMDMFYLDVFAKILIQEYELQKRIERRNVKSELGYSRVGLNNV